MRTVLRRIELYSWTLHVTTVAFNMASWVAVILSVDIMSAMQYTGVRFATSEMREDSTFHH